MKTIFFDLDGTLLPMDNDVFAKYYFSGLANYMQDKGFSKETLFKVILEGTMDMLNNDGHKTNEDVFWDGFYRKTNVKKEEVEEDFIHFYQTDFIMVKIATKTNPFASEIIKVLKEKNYQLILATNPVFPLVATSERIKWAGLNIDDFVHITTYDNSSYCKPNLNYFKEILKRFNLKANDCMMIGNDVQEDMISSKLGFSTYLVLDNLINRNNEDISIYQRGTLQELLNFVNKLPKA